MRRLFLITAILMANVLVMSAAKKTVINQIEPTDWYVGMKNPSVQLMVYGQGIRDVASVTTDYPGVTIDSLVRLDSPNYLLIYLNLRDAQPGTMTLNFGKTKVPYQLKAREKKGEERMGSPMPTCFICSCQTVLHRVPTTPSRSRVCVTM